MAFTYVNPGYGELLDVSGATTVEDAKCNPYSGVGFWHKRSDVGVVLPEIPSEIFVHVSFFINTSALSSADTAVKVGNNNGIQIKESYRVWKIYVYCNNTEIKTINEEETNLNILGANDILLHIRAGNDDNGLISVMVNGEEIYTTTRNVSITKTESYSIEPNALVLCSKTERVLLSNIIASDSPVGCKEKVGILPFIDTDTNMTANEDGSYTASAEGQHFLQTIDAETLIRTYGGASRVSGLYLSGNPAYTTGEELRKAIACGGKEVISDIASVTLAMDNAAKAIIGGNVSMTLEDLRGYKFGWKAGV